MKTRYFQRVERSSLSMAEQTDHVNYLTFIEEFKKSGKLPSSPGLPIGSYDHQDDDYDVDVPDEAGTFQEDRADRYMKYRTMFEKSHESASDPQTSESASEPAGD